MKVLATSKGEALGRDMVPMIRKRLRSLQSSSHMATMDYVTSGDVLSPCR